MKLKYEKIRLIKLEDWDNFIEETFQRPYSFQQQEGCQERGVYRFSVPNTYPNDDDEMYDSIPEEVNGEKMGVKLKTWLSRDPKRPLSDSGSQESWHLRLFWKRNFYPDIFALIDHLYDIGKLEEGEYIINIDW